jgi:tryptophan-rich sensory protein
MSEPSAWRRNARIAALPLAAVVAASLLGQLATFPNLAPWYAGLVKPSFNPPNWIFGPVWTALYGLMVYATYRILKLAPTPAQRTAIVLFYVQLALNAAWPWMFFAAHSPALGMANVVPQLIFVVATAVAFIRLDRIAGICLLPLIAWVTFATALNAAIWQLNG